MLCAAPTVLIGLANADPALRARRARAACASSPPARRPRPPRSAPSKRSWAGPSRRSTGSPRPRPSSPSASRDPSTTALDVRGSRANQGAAGRRADHVRRVARRGRRRSRRAARWRDARRDRRARQRHHGGLLQRSGGHAGRDSRRLVSHRRCRRGAPRRLRRDSRSHQGRDHQRRREHLIGRSRGGAGRASRGHGGWRGRAAAREVGRGAVCVRGAEARRVGDGGGTARVLPSKLAHFKVPHGFTFVPDLPRTATGKIQKFVLRKNRPNMAAQ